MKPNKYKYILWDIDNTLIDFKKSERAALDQCFLTYDIQLNDHDLEVYSTINHNYWNMLERGEIEKEVLLVKRFEDFMKVIQREDVDCYALNKAYQEALGDYAVMFEGALELCLDLQKTKEQYAITNGTKVAQDKKLDLTGLIHVFKDVFISEVVGYEKPNVLFFQYCFDRIPNFNKEEAIIIGDSLTSDMQGANNVGIDCCFYNPNNLEIDTNLTINYHIHHLDELRKIL